MDTSIRVQPIDVVLHRGRRIDNANTHRPGLTAETCARRTSHAKDMQKTGITSAWWLLPPTVLIQGNCLKERLAYYMPMERADRKAPGKDATPKWSEVIPNTLVKLVIFTIKLFCYHCIYI